MAIINVELRMMIAERLANDNYREEIKEVKESLRLHLLAYLKENYIPKEVQTVFEKYPQFFKAVEAIYIASYNFKNYLPAEWGSRTHHADINFHESLPLDKEEVYTLLKSIPKENYIHELMCKYFKYGETMCIPSSKGRRERYFKQINGIIYEITYDTPPDE